MRVLGVFLIVSNIPQLAVTLGYNFIYLHLQGQTITDLSTSIINGLIIRSITILLGIWLIVGNKAIINSKNKIMNFIDAANIKDQANSGDNKLQPPIDDKKE